MTDPDGQSGEWLLVTTFRGVVGKVVAKSRAPEAVLEDSQDLLRALKKVRTLGVVTDMSLLAKEAERVIRAAIAHRSPKVGEQPVAFRDHFFRPIATPAVSGADTVFAVWLWVGLDGIIPPEPPVTAAWAWDIKARPALATYGPGVGPLYRRDDLRPGKQYDINEIAAIVAPTVDVSAIAPLLLEPVDGTTFALAPEPDRGQDGAVSLAAMRAITEVVYDPDLERWEWRGVTWDVTHVDPPSITPQRVLAQMLAGPDVWTATAYWSPIQLVSMTGSRQRPAELRLDPSTHKADLRPDSRAEVRRMLEELDVAESATARIWLGVHDGGYAPYDVAAVRLRDSTVPAAAVSLRRASQ